jgi:hypothetical protein
VDLSPPVVWLPLSRANARVRSLLSMFTSDVPARLGPKARLWLGPRRLWLSRNLGQAKAPTDGLALARLGQARLLAEKMCILA